MAAICCCGGGGADAEPHAAAPATVEDAHVLLSDAERAVKNDSRLSAAQTRRNTAQSAAVFTFYAGLAVATAGSSLLIQAAASLVPVPVGWALPHALKNSYYLGYKHQRGKSDVAAEGEEAKRRTLAQRVMPTNRDSGAADATRGCFVWSLLSYQDANKARVTVFGGSQVRAAYEATGVLLCTLELLDGVLQLVLTSGKPGSGSETSTRLPVHHMDQVQYVSCGLRPFQSKWHVTVEDGRPVSVVVKTPKAQTGNVGVSMPEKSAIVAVAARCRVWQDGSSGCAQPPHELSAKQVWKDLTQSVDVERLNLFANRLKKRLEAPEQVHVPRPLSAGAPGGPR